MADNQRRPRRRGDVTPESLPITARRAGPAAPGTVAVTVAVLTYRRPAKLRSLLPLLLAQAQEVSDDPAGTYQVNVLVVDNDPDLSGASVLADIVAPELRYVAEPTPGIAAARNRALDEAARSRLLAFIDDDEQPESGWLTHLIATWEHMGATAVAGRVRVESASYLDPWIVAGGFFSRRSMPTGTAVDVAPTSNLLLDLTQVEALGVRFEPALGLAGGEDHLFTSQLTRAGGRIVWCDESVVIDKLPAERMTRNWVLRRAWSHGNGTVITDLRLAEGVGSQTAVRLRWTARGLIRVAGGSLRWTWGGLCRSRRHRARGLRAVYRGAGMISATCGVVVEEYARERRRWRFRVGVTE